MHLLTALLLLQAPSFEDRKLATVPEGVSWDDLTFSPDGRHVLFATKGDKSAVFLDDRQIDSGGWPRIVGFAPDGRPAFLKIKAGAEQSQLVVGDWKSDVFSSVHSVAFSGDGRSIAFVGVILDHEHKEQQEYVVVDGRRSEKWNQVLSLRFGPKGVTYHATAQTGQGSAYFVVNEGTKSAAYEGMGDLVFGADGSLVAFVAEKDDREFVVWGAGRKSESHPGVFWVHVSPDGSTLSYAANEGDPARRVVIGDRKSPKLETLHALERSPDGKHVAYITTRGGKCAVVVDERTLAEGLDTAEGLAFSPDGTKVAWCGSQGGKHFVSVDDKRVQQEGTPSQLQWAPDGHDVLFVLRAGGRATLATPREVGGPAVDDIAHVTLNAALKSVAFAAKKDGKWTVFVQRRSSEPFDVVGPPRFAGDKVVFPAMRGREVFWKVMDAK